MSDPSASCLLYLPDVALEKIFSFFTYDEIANYRVVCSKFNEIGSRLLSRGFLRLEKKHAFIYKQVKSVLPRRESERKVHPLARHCDILQAVETRISMLNMTYMKYIENNLLCFIPGKVLDEIESVLYVVEHCTSPPRTHQLLQELRDLSSMAMEHFDEHILPRVKEQMERKTALLASYGTSPNSSRMLITHRILLSELHKVKKQNRVQKYSIASLSQNTQKLFLKLRRQSLRLRAQSIVIREQERKLQEQATKIQEQENAVADIKKHMDEWDQKYVDLTTELVRARDDILSKTSQSVKSLASQSHVQPKYYVPNIKPRVAQVKICTSLHSDLERKRKSDISSEDIPSKLFVYESAQLEDNSKTKKEFCRKEPFKEDYRDIKSGSSLSSALGRNYSRNERSSVLSDISEEKSKLLGINDISYHIGSSITSSLEALFKTPIVKSRKRKMSEDIDLK